MTHVWITSVLMLLLMCGGVFVAAALGIAGGYGLTQLLSFDRMISIVGRMGWQQSTNFLLIALPLFLLMGELLLQAGMMQRIYNAASKIVAALPGGLMQTNIAASMLFAACSGSSLASAATIGSVGYPQLSKRGYDARLALGSIAAGGTLGILIPPSIIFIIYGTLAEVSIGKLFLAGIIPGIALGLVFAIYIGVRVLLNPSLAPKEPASSLKEVGFALLSLWQLGVLLIVIFGGIYGGFASPTEIAGVAAALTMIFAAIEGKLTLKILMSACLNTVRQTSMLMLVIIMAKVLSLTLVYGQVPNLVMEWVDSVGLNETHLVIFVIVLYLVMGMFFDGVSMMVITLPFILPILNAANIDLVWFGVIVCMTIEIGLLTPPVGLNLFVMQGSTGEQLRTIVYGSLPFVGLQLVVMGAICAYPALATYIPQNLF